MINSKTIFATGLENIDIMLQRGCNHPYVSAQASMIKENEVF